MIMTEAKWQHIFPDIEAVIRKALIEAGKDENDLPVLMLEIKDILFNY